MKKWIEWLLPFVILLAAGLAALWSLRTRPAPAPVGVPDTADSRLIQATILKSFMAEDQVILTGDTSLFTTVFVNDPRGGPLVPAQLKRLQDATGDSSRTDFGYLDWMIESFTVRPIPQATKRTLDFTAGPQTPLPTAPPGPMMPRTSPLQLKFTSIVVDGDRAVAMVDDWGNISQTVLVKIGGKWLIAGNKYLKIVN